MIAITQPIDDAINQISSDILERSGAVFYSGPTALDGPRDVYVLGLNPGGSPINQAGNTVERHLEKFRSKADAWSEYADESWEGAIPGTWGMQPRVLHMFRELGRDIRNTPSSSVVFVRSNNEEALLQEKGKLLRACWPVHKATIEALKIRTVICFGKTAGAWVRENVSASTILGKWSETNNRGWTSTAHISGRDLAVITLTHPSRTGWENPLADPTPFVRKVINR